MSKLRVQKRSRSARAPLAAATRRSAPPVPSVWDILALTSTSEEPPTTSDGDPQSPEKSVLLDLRGLPPNAVHAALPEVVAVLVGRQNSEIVSEERKILRDFLCQFCSASLNAALKVAWLANAHAEWAASDPDQRSFCLELSHDVELCGINGCAAPGAAKAQERVPDPGHERDALVSAKVSPPVNLDDFVAKQKRAECWNAHNDLVNILDRISAALGAIPRTQRTNQLREWLSFLNDAIPSGVSLPLSQDPSSPHYSIASFLASESVCLSSRDHVPFTMVLEVLVSDFPCSSSRVYEAFGADSSCSVSSLAQIDSALTKVRHDAEKAEDAPISASNPLLLREHVVPIDPNGLADPFGEPWLQKRARLEEGSSRSTRGLRPHETAWDLRMVIFKAGDDLRQELMAMQLISEFARIWSDAKLPLQLTPFHILVCGPSSGFVEVVRDAVSIDSLKKRMAGFTSLVAFFKEYFPVADSPKKVSFATAQRNFIESMAAYSLVSYFLQLKDRHNGNILLDRFGRVVHIDFGFAFASSPGGNIGFESAPFKLTAEQIEVMGGEDSEGFNYFQVLILRGFLESRKHVHKFAAILNAWATAGNLACFGQDSAIAVADFSQRFSTEMTEAACVSHVHQLVSESVAHWRTRMYDIYQRVVNSISS